MADETKDTTKEKEKQKKLIDKLIKVANRKANEIMSIFEASDRSVRWAEIFLQHLESTIETAFMSKANKTKVEELGIKVQIEDKDENDEYVKILKKLGDLSVTEATKILSGMNKVIEGKLTKEKINKKIKELEVVFTSDEQPKA